MISSMTGYARAGADHDGYRIEVELKSLNAKGLDIRARVPGFLDGYDIALRKELQAKFKRGSLNVTVQCERTGGSDDLAVNQEWLAHLLSVSSKAYQKDPDNVAKPRVDSLMAVRGVIESDRLKLDAEARTAIETAILETLKLAADDLQKRRSEEGRALAAALTSQLNEIADIKRRCTDLADARSEGFSARLNAALDRLSEQDVPVSEDRLAQEIAMLTVRGDICEELDRLEAHIIAIRALLDKSRPVGRELDFLCQELNREANTLCSKAQDQSLTELGVRLKVVIDQFREQVQNIE